MCPNFCILDNVFWMFEFFTVLIPIISSQGTGPSVVMQLANLGIHYEEFVTINSLETIHDLVLVKHEGRVSVDNAFHNRKMISASKNMLHHVE